MASQVLISISKDEEERFRRMSEEKYQLDMQSRLTDATRDGMQKGRKEGKKEGQQEIVELLKSGKSPEEIIKEYENPTS